MRKTLLRANALCAALVLAGCAGEMTAPAEPVKLTIATSAREAQVAPPGSVVSIAPAIVVTDPNGLPVPNVYVSFSVASGGGAVGTRLAKTDANGFATCGSWTLGTANGPNQVIASLEGGPSLTFAAFGMTLPIGTDMFDLVSQAGQPVPNNHGPALAASIVVAGRLALAPDATYASVYVRYDASAHQFALEEIHGPFSLSGSQLTLANYTTGVAAVGVIQADALVLRSGDPDSRVQEDVYVRVPDTRP